MDLLQLEHFLAVVEERTFTRAAERVGRTQPAISQSVKKLEDEMGAPLFARDLHDVSLTEAGRVLVEYARKMVRARDDAMRDVGALKTLKTGTLNIAAHESAAVYLLPAPLRTYLARYPDVKVGIFRSRLADIPRQVLDREVDLGFVKDEPGFRDLKWIDVHADEMVVIAPPGHPLVRRADVHVGAADQWVAGRRDHHHLIGMDIDPLQIAESGFVLDEAEIDLAIEHLPGDVREPAAEDADLHVGVSREVGPERRRQEVHGGR